MNVTVKKSKIKGKGAYAKKNFKKDEVVIKWHPTNITSKRRYLKLFKDEQDHTTYIGNDQYAIMGSPERYVNHSCNPNTYVKNKKDIAIRDIKKNEEITTDYSLNGVDKWKMKCNCGSKNCRKIIYGNFKKLDPKTKKKLKPYLESWYKKEN